MMNADYIQSALGNLRLGFALLQDGLFVYANNAFAYIYGCTVEEILAKSNAGILNMVHPEDLEWAMKDYSARLSGDPVSSSIEMRIIQKDGTIRWIEGIISAVDYKGKPALQMEVMDITKHKNAELEILQTSERLRLALETNNAGTWDWDIVNNSFYWSPQFLIVFGLPEDTVAGFETWTKCVHPDDLELSSQKISEAIRDHTELVNDYRIILASGEVRSIRAVGRTIYEGEQPLRMVGLCIDVTDRKNNENELQQKILELERFNEMTVGRELVMVELKKEINLLLKDAGRDEKYIIVN